MRWLMVVLALAGCQLGGGAAPDLANDIAPPSAIVGPAVEVTRLDAPPAAADPAADPSAPPATIEPAARIVADAPAPAPVVVTKSADEIACEKRGGSFVAFGISRLKSCQTPTRDSGKQCRRESDCEGVCLARSGTCAPVTPLFGCNAVLQDDGRRVDLCLD